MKKVGEVGLTIGGTYSWYGDFSAWGLEWDEFIRRTNGRYLQVPTYLPTYLPLTISKNTCTYGGRVLWEQDGGFALQSTNQPTNWPRNLTCTYLGTHLTYLPDLPVSPNTCTQQRTLLSSKARFSEPSPITESVRGISNPEISETVR